MRIHDVEQGTRKWLEVRAGIPTASEFDSIITPGGKPSTSFDRYLHELLAERIMQRPRVGAVTMWMKRGTIMEKKARRYYEFTRDVKVQQVGFITNDAGTIGASPDGLVDEDGCTEFKCPSEHIHVGYLLAKQGKGVDKAYKVQVMGQLWITERQWVDIVSFHPDMPEAMFRVERDEAFITELAARVTEFSRVLENMTLQLMEEGLIKPRAETPELTDEEKLFDMSLGVTHEDAETILRHHFPQMYANAEPQHFGV